MQERHVIDLKTFIRQSTGLSADIFKLDRRGYLRPGYFADVVVFDLAKVHAAATYLEPTKYAEGMLHVLVNGKFAVKDSQPTHTLNGRVLRGPAVGKQLTAVR